MTKTHTSTALAASWVLATAVLSACGSSGAGLGSGGSAPAATGGTASGGGMASGGGIGGSSGESSSGGGGSGGLGSGGAIGSGGLFGSGGELGSGGSSGGTQGVGGSSGGQLGTGGQQGSGGESSFSPCPTEGPCKVLPLGDSITVGVGSESAGGGGYRVELFRLAVDAGYAITFTGTQTPNGPMMVQNEVFPRQHGGISGQVIEEIGDRIPSPELTEAPHIILVHAGTNDLTFNPQGAEQRFEPFLDELIAAAPEALVVIGGVIPMSFYDVTPYNAHLEQVVLERASEGAHVLFVDHFEGFPMGELNDQVHPNVAGYARMAAKWFSAIEPYLNQP